MLDRLLALDRRWVFLAMAVAVATPVLTGTTFPETPTPMTRDTFAVLDALPKGSRVLIALDYDPAGMSELHPMAAAFTRHAAVKGHKIYFLTLWPTGPAFVDDMVRILRDEFPGLEYGEDYVNLGYRTGNEGVIKVIVNDLRRSYGEDVRKVALANIPMTRDIKSVRQMDLIVSVSGGTPGTKEWVQYASTPYGIETISGVTGVQTPLFVPYIPRQLDGMLGGIKAAAEYEYLLLENYPQVEGEIADAAPPDVPVTSTAAKRSVREALRRMGPQVVAHLLMVSLIVIGNVLYFAGRGRGRA